MSAGAKHAMDEEDEAHRLAQHHHHHSHYTSEAKHELSSPQDDKEESWEDSGHEWS
jgi:hypothetical protein